MAKELRLSDVSELNVTPGEWKLKPSGNGIDRNIISDESIMPIAQYVLPEDAKLICAAPDMYDVLYYIYQQKAHMDIGLAERIRKALEKAGM